MEIIKAKDKEYQLTDMTFGILSSALAAGTSGTGFSRVEAGKVVFDGLYMQNQEKLEELQRSDNLKVYFALCLQAYKLVEFDEAELKKNSESIE